MQTKEKTRKTAPKTLTEMTVTGMTAMRNIIFVSSCSFLFFFFLDLFASPFRPSDTHPSLNQSLKSIQEGSNRYHNKVPTTIAQKRESSLRESIHRLSPSGTKDSHGEEG